MLIIYEDEYGTVVHWHNTADTTPSVGDIIAVHDEEFHVRSRVFYPLEGKVVLIVAESAARKMQAESVDNSRLNQMRSAIIHTNKRVDEADKKNRALSDQLSSVKKSVNRQIKQEKKDPQ